MDYIEQILESDLKKSILFNKIMEQNKLAWENRLNPKDIFMWLRNYSNEDEIYYALILVEGLLFYTKKQIRYLWNLLLTNRIKQYFFSTIIQNSRNKNINQLFIEYLQKRCIFVGYGSAGKSGQSMVYTFKQSHKIEGLVYMELHEFLTTRIPSKIKTIILLDDFLGTGNQALATWEKEISKNSFKRISSTCPKLKFIYLVLVAYRTGREKFERASRIKVITGEELDERFKCFSPFSVIFKNDKEREIAKNIMFNKGRFLFHKHPLGYGNLQLCVAFDHNTPNNSLPVIWKRIDDGSWIPLFERY